MNTGTRRRVQGILKIGKTFFSLTLTFLLLLSLYSPVVDASVVELKDISGHTFEAEIRKLYIDGLIKGFPDGTFRPENSITRAEAAVLLAQVKKLTPIKLGKSPFKDVTSNHWAYGYIVAVQIAGFMKGYPDSTFKPEVNISRAELAVILGKAKGLDREEMKVTQAVALANDEVSIPKWVMGWVSLGYFPQNQYLNYRVGRMVAPLSPATRGEVAYGIHQILYPPKKGGVVQIAMNAEPDTLNTWVGIMMAMHVVNFTWSFPPAVGRDDAWVPYPGVLKDRPSVEKGTIKIKGKELEVIYSFREGIRYSDGEEADVDDWAYAFMVLQDPLVPTTKSPLDEKVDLAKGKGAYGVKGFDILDRYTVKVYYREPEWRVDLWVPGAWLPGSMAMYPKHILEKAYSKMKETGNTDYFRKDEVMSRKPAGYGPYRVADWRHGSHITLEKNPYFFFGEPLLDGIIIRFIPDTTALLARVISGKNLDVAALGLGLDQALVLEERGPKHTKVYLVEGFIFEHIGFNMDDSILKDIRVRRALAHATDREKIVNTLFIGKQKAAHTFFHPNHWAFNPQAKKYIYDLVKARSLLEEVGWKVGPDGIRVKEGKRLQLTLETIAGDSLREKVQAVLAFMWKEIGVELDISKNRPSAAFTTRARRREWPHMIMFAWTFRPTSMGESLFREDYIPTPENNYTGNNWYGYRNKEVTDILTHVSSEMTESGRRKMLYRMEENLLEDLPVLPLYFRLDVTTAKVNLKNFKPSGISDTPPTWNVFEWYFK